MCEPMQWNASSVLVSGTSFYSDKHGVSGDRFWLFCCIVVCMHTSLQTDHGMSRRVTTHLENMENLENLGNSKVVREKSGEAVVPSLDKKWGHIKILLSLLALYPPTCELVVPLLVESNACSGGGSASQIPLVWYRWIFACPTGKVGISYSGKWSPWSREMIWSASVCFFHHVVQRVYIEAQDILIFQHSIDKYDQLIVNLPIAALRTLPCVCVFCLNKVAAVFWWRRSGYSAV